MPEKYFTVPEFLTRHLQILQKGGGRTPVSYSYAPNLVVGFVVFDCVYVFTF